MRSAVDEVCKYNSDCGQSEMLRRSLQKVFAKTLGERDYVMGGFGINTHLDAGDHPDVLARYISDHFQDESATNVEFVKLKKHKCALVVALRDIYHGEELYVSYGRGYWTARGLLEK